MSEGSFQVSTRDSGSKRTVRVHVYDTWQDMDKGRLAWDLWVDGKPGEDGNLETMGWTQSAYSSKNDELMIIHIQLMKGHLSTEIVSHEVEHAAIRIWRHDCPGDLEDIEYEEKLCYITSSLMSRVVDKFYDKQLL